MKKIFVAALVIALFIGAAVPASVAASDPPARVTSVSLSADFVTIRGELPSSCWTAYYTVSMTKQVGRIVQNITVYQRNSVISCDPVPVPFTLTVKRVYGATIYVNGRLIR